MEEARTEINSHRDLKVRQVAMSIAEEAYKFSRTFPPSEKFILTSQLRRAAISIAASIAQGYGRDSTGAYVNFLRIAQGSLKELDTLVALAGRVVMAPNDSVAPFLRQCDELGRMLRSLIRSIERSAAQPR